MQILNYPILEAIGWTLIHSIWQATLVALLFYIIHEIMANAPAKKRFDLGGMALFMQLILTISTFLIYLPSSSASFAGPTAFTFSIEELTISSSSSFNWITALGILWFLGALFFTIRLAGGLWYTKQLATSGNLLSEEWQLKCKELAQKIGLQKSIQLFSSAMAKVPMTVQHFKPVILFPVGLINQLTVEEIEAIIAHELAHIKRNDFLFNIFFSFIEALFYFHPAIWWISARMNDAREESCDELAIELLGKPRTYAQTLLRVQETTNNSWFTSQALAFSGKKNHLKNRIAKILNINTQKPRRRDRAIAFLAIAVLSAGIWFSNVSATLKSDAKKAVLIHVDEMPMNENLATQEQFYEFNVSVDESGNLQEMILSTTENSDTDDQHKFVHVEASDKLTKTFFINEPIHKVKTLHFPNRRIHITRDTLPQKGRYSFNHSDNGLSTELQLNNGKIEKLVIDGEVIAPEDYDEYAEVIEEISSNNFEYSRAEEMELAREEMKNAMEEMESIESERLSILSEREEEMANIEEEMHERQAEMEALMEERQSEMERSMEEIQEEQMERSREMKKKMMERKREMEQRRTEMMEEMQEREEEMNISILERRYELNREIEKNRYELREQMENRKRAIQKGQEQLQKELLKDGIIQKTSRLKIEIDRGKIKVNGKRLTPAQEEKYIDFMEDQIGLSIHDGMRYQYKMTK